MRNFNYQPPRGAIRFFHVCTSGEDAPILFREDNDYQTAINLSALCAYRLGVRIIAFCHMSNHSHFVIWCESEDQARSFIESFKREYSRFYASKHPWEHVFRKVDTTVKEISDTLYLKRCVSYVLLNPVVAGIVFHPESYRWSSFDAYFNNETLSSDSIPASEMTFRQMRNFFHTEVDLKNTSFIVNGDGCIYPKSFVDYEFVENLFKTRSVFYKQLAITDSASEEMIYSPFTVRYSDLELFAEAQAISEKKYRTHQISSLTKQQKQSLIVPLYRKSLARPRRIARILALPPSEVCALVNEIKDTTITK